MTAIKFRKALELLAAWNEAKKMIHEEVDAPTQFPFCKCLDPHLVYWCNSPDHPYDYETEACRKCDRYTLWGRTKNGADIHGWHQERNIQTGEVRYRSENEELLLTQSEYESRILCRGGYMPDEEVRSICKEIANKFDIPIATWLIGRRLGRIAAISERIDSQKQRKVVGMVCGRGRDMILF